MFYPTLVLLFILRLCGRSVDLLKLVRRNYGRDGLKVYREVEKFSKKVTKNPRKEVM